MRDWITNTCTGVATAAALMVALEGFEQGADRTIQERLGYPASARLLVIHADDLGMAHSVNRATFEALEQGLITSASILVPCPWFPEVARWAQAHPEADLGIHLALNSEWTGYRWGPVSSAGEVPSLLDAQGYLPLTEPMVVARARIPEVERELRAQIDRAKTAGIRLSHLDSHMATLFRSRELFEVYRRMGESFTVCPCSSSGRETEAATQASWQTGRRPALRSSIGWCRSRRASSAAGWMAAYEKLLAPLPPGVYQLIVHLAYDDEEMRGADARTTSTGAPHGGSRTGI